MKFKNYIETESGIKDTSTSPGAAGQVLSSTVSGTSWIDQSTLVSGSAERVSILVKNSEGTALVKGDPVYIIGSVGASARLEVGLCDASDPSKMPCVGLLEQDLLNNGQGTAVTAGKLRNLSTTPIDGQPTTENDTIYVKAGGSSGLALTTTKPTGSTNLIQNVGQVGRVSASSDGNFVVSAIMRTNDVPNLPTGKIWVGDGNTTVSTVVHLDETNGRMGIGTTSPGATFHVSGGAIRIDDAQQLQFGNGNVNIRNDASGRMYLRAPLAYFFEGNGGYKMVLNGGNGNLGIGTTSPAQKLHVIGNSEITGDLYLGRYIFHDNDTNTWLGFPLADTISFRTNGSDRMYINSSGNVGIGTTSPSYKLDVAGDLRVDNGNVGPTSGDEVEHIKVQGGRHFLKFKEVRTADDSEWKNTTFKLQAGVDSTNHQSIDFVADGSYNEHIDIRTGNQVFNTRFTYDGKVGIGTTSPDARLEVEDSGALGANKDVLSITNKLTSSATVDTTVGMNFNLQQSTNPAITYGAIRVGEHSGTGAIKGSMRFMVQDYSGGFNLAERMRIESDGNVGIGTTNPAKKLTIGNIGIGDTDGLKIEDPSNTAYGAHYSYDDASSTVEIGGITNNVLNDCISIARDATRAITINALENVGIGATSPTYKLDVNGTGRFTNTLYYSSLVQQSQADTKKDIANIDKNKATAIPFKQYKYKTGDTERVRYGVVVEDIEQYYPELVHIGEDGIKGVSYIDLLVKRVAELEKELEDILLTPGPKGNTGATGPKGDTGATGPQGPAGKDGQGSSTTVFGCKGETLGTLGNMTVCDETVSYEILDPKSGKQIDTLIIPRIQK